ncbi:hypothetical protein A1OW_11170 [Enterovibrio norvegicus]|uniref:DUF2971 domain-containing protein n=1 Tax=Enterovibrio norvegicus TaxID=188144 RepID=UPI0002F5D467|nr:DUF2971 domain-containing protein [Enterovibrio norvegicus]OEF50248.1 hypothetical protein A1OW_11170 [Enterovibrio norvegicus]
MNQADDKKLIDWIKNQEFSKVAFLAECWDTHENEWYLGFYYFIQYLKQENLDDVLAKIVSRYHNESSAYCYLGDVANKIYDSFNEQYIPASFYRHAISFNAYNAEAHWGLFVTSHSPDSCIRSLKSDNESGQFKRLGYKIDNLAYHKTQFSKFSDQDWQAIKRFMQDERVKCGKEMLVFAHFYLDETEEALSLIHEMDNVDIEIIKTYFDRGFISKELALSKLYCFSFDQLLGDDHQSIYQAHVQEAQKGEANPTLSVLIQKAFRAKEYKDVVTYYEEAPEDQIFMQHDAILPLYYLLALSYLNHAPNKQALMLANSKASTLRDESLALYQAVKCRHNIDALERIFSEREFLNLQIRFMGAYQEAIDTLNNSLLIKHYLHEPMSKDLDSLKTKWNNAYHNHQLAEMKAKLANGDMQGDDFQRLHNFGIECGEFDFVINSINEFHKNNTPTMSSYNSIGVCHYFKEEFSTAIEYYKLALDLMVSSKEYSHTIISNYISCTEKLPDIKIEKDDLDTLRNKYNIELTNRFKWDIFTAKTGSLFKYSPFNINTIDALTNQYLYLASKGQLNDPIELPTLSKLDSDSLVEPTNYRICSLSNNQNSMLMWSHYAQEHQGIMVEYWFGGEFPCGVGVAKVDYADHTKRNREKDLYVFNQYLLTKNKEWEYESEVRIFSNQKETVGFYNYDYPNNDRDKINAQIRSITLGCNFPENKKRLIKNIVNSLNNHRKSHEQKVVLREALISEDNNFALEYRDIHM